MTQKNGVGLKVKAEKGSGKYWGGAGSLARGGVPRKWRWDGWGFYRHMAAGLRVSLERLERKSWETLGLTYTF